MARTPYDDRFRAAAGAASRSRPDVDADLAEELMLGAATILWDGLALDGLDEHDTDLTVGLLCEDLVAPDPSAAVRASAQRVLSEPGGLHEPEAVSAALLVSAAVLQL